MEFPLKMNVLSVEKHPTDGETCVECFYTIVDAKGDAVLPRNHFVCKAREFDVVAKYTLERTTARYAEATPFDVVASPLVQAQINALRATATPAPAAPPPTPLDQMISPPGPVRKVAVK